MTPEKENFGFWFGLLTGAASLVGLSLAVKNARALKRVEARRAGAKLGENKALNWRTKKMIESLSPTQREYIGPGEKIGAGAHGAVFTRGTGIIKITEDADDAYASAQLREKQRDDGSDPHPVFFTIAELVGAKKAFAIEAERVDDLPQREQDYMRVLQDALFEMQHARKPVNESFVNSLRIACDDAKADPRCRDFAEEVAGTLRQLRARGVTPEDTHAGNFGRRRSNGKLVMLDFGLTSSPERALPALAGAAMTRVGKCQRRSKKYERCVVAVKERGRKEGLAKSEATRRAHAVCSVSICKARSRR